MRTIRSLDASRREHAPRRPQRSFLGLALLALAFTAGGCSFATLDLRRPLAVDALETSDLDAYPCGYTDTFKWTSRALRYFRVTKYDPTVYVNISDDARAIHSCTANQFAWVQLGADLALAQQPRLAVKATEEALTRRPLAGDMDRLRVSATAVWSRISQLQVVASLNLASYDIALEDYHGAEDALAQVKQPAQLDAFRRLAYYWLAAQASAGLGEIDKAAAALDIAEQVAQHDLDQLPVESKIDYPQYFSSKLRQANHLYLEGQIHLAARDLPGAVAKLQAALSKDSRLWEAHFALANALYEQGQNGLAEIELEHLMSDMPKAMFWRPERIAFNLGNTYLAQEKWKQAAQSFREATEIAQERASLSRKRLAGLLDDRHVTGAVRDILGAGLDEDGIFAEAYNNLGISLLGLWRTNRSSQNLARAENAFTSALASPGYGSPYVAHANLARVYRLSHRNDAYLQEIRLSLMIRPTYRPAVEDLYASSLAMSAAERIASYNVLLDALSEWPKGSAVYQYSDWLNEVDRFLEDNPGLPMALRAKAQLLRLRGREAPAREIYSAAGDAQSLVWKSVGMAQLDWESGTADKREVEDLLSKAIQVIETPSAGSPPDSMRKLPWSPFDARKAYVLRGKVRLKLGNEDGARLDFAKASKVGPGA